MRISDWSSDVCSSDLWPATHQRNKMSGKAVGGRLKHRAMSISFSEERRDHLAFVNEDTDPTGRLGHLHRRPHCTARFRAITLEYRDFGKQQFKRDRRSNGAHAHRSATRRFGKKSVSKC